jgi:hypothetical protein
MKISRLPSNLSDCTNTKDEALWFCDYIRELGRETLIKVKKSVPRYHWAHGCLFRRPAATDSARDRERGGDCETFRRKQNRSLSACQIRESSVTGSNSPFGLLFGLEAKKNQTSLFSNFLLPSSRPVCGNYPCSYLLPKAITPRTPVSHFSLLLLLLPSWIRRKSS